MNEILDFNFSRLAYAPFLSRTVNCNVEEMARCSGGRKFVAKFMCII